MSKPASRALPRPTLFAALLLFAAPSMAVAQGTPEQQEACTPDAVRLCSATIPDIPKTTACMKAHVAQLSPRCRAAFNDVTAAPKTRVATRTEAPRAAIRDEPPRALSHDGHAAASRQERARLASREERRLPARAPVEEGAPRASLPGALPDEGLDLAAPSPGAGLPGLKGYKASIAADCRAGLIDPFTCRNTLDALSLAE